MLNIRSSHIPPLTVKLSIELRSDGPAFGAKAIDRRLGLINSRALSLHDLTLHHTAQFHRLQTTIITAMSDTCSRICRPYRSWKFWRNHNMSTFLSPDVHNAHQDQAVLDHLHKTVRDAARIYHDNVASSLVSGIHPLNDSLGNAIFEAYEAWTKPLPSEVCHEIFAASCDATDYYKEKPQITWMNQLFVALKGEQDALSMSKHDLDHYLAAVDPQAWTTTLPAHTKDMDVEDKKQWIWKVGKQVRQGVSIGSADMKPHFDDANDVLP
ncbi:uncharacterized protein J4E92_010368 [Alternaria infectoria]|uniref:uncharacterized protein n=1 Tax=Alternaria infectoria TaxID=45303 RepID=UPI00221E4AC2|nr:uncharacterized protein J4E92_010368 [Alternaria infectoria]KAI4910609.1 hypothetical protein J4E92_010368 [Alternaria infectoria]